MTVFNSRDSAFKSKFGSVEAGENVRFSVQAPRNMGCSGVYFVIKEDQKEERFYPLAWKSTDGMTEWWSLDFEFSKEGLYFYHFQYDAPFGRAKILKGKNGEGVLNGEGGLWQETVYKKGFKTPENFKGGVMYQIFPDRFFFSGEKKKDVPADRVYHSDFNEIPCFYENRDLARWNVDFYGGDLKGIEMKLPYLKSLGATVIYLNPIFLSHSNHRYDTADYMKIDPLLGDEDDFKSLLESAKKLGVDIIFDGVFSHTGDDSVYFNKYKRYASVGAYDGSESVYYKWYKFHGNADNYDSWWGIKTLPEVNEEEESFKRFITGEGGVIDKWMKMGAFGVRLDVADELPDDFIESVREAVKRNNPEGLVLGEVWEDASNKISYGGRRKYLLGNELDSVMNYPFRTAIIDFLNTSVAEDFIESVWSICENYPKPALDCLMNPLGTHDTVRIIDCLGGLSSGIMDKESESVAKLSDDKMNRAKKLLKIGLILNFTLPGVPSIYYGDEILTEGLGDPFNRKFFDWNKLDDALNGRNDSVKEIIDLIKFLSDLRKKYKSLKTGTWSPISGTLGCVAYKRETENEKIIVIANNNPHDIIYYLPWDLKNAIPLTKTEIRDGGAAVRANEAVILFVG